jgi:WD40 repeat protein
MTTEFKSLTHACLLALSVSLAVFAQKPELVVQTGLGRVQAIAFSPDGQILATCSERKMVKLWSVRSGQELRAFADDVAPEYVGFSPDGKILMTGGNDGVALWDVSSGARLRVIVGRNPSDDCNGSLARISPDGAIIACLCSPGIQLWDARTGAKLRTLEEPGRIYSLAFSPDGDNLAVGVDYGIRIWDVGAARILRTLRGHAKSVVAVTYSPNGQILASRDNEQTIKLRDAATGKEIGAINVNVNQVFVSIAFSHDSRSLAIGQYGSLIFWDVVNVKQIRVFSVDSESFGNVAFSPDGRILASVDNDSIRFFDVATGKTISTLTGYTGKVSAVAFSPTGRALMSVNDSGFNFTKGIKESDFKGYNKFNLWGADVSQDFRALKGEAYGLHSVIFSSDGKTVIGPSVMIQDNHTKELIKQWDVMSGIERESTRKKPKLDDDEYVRDYEAGVVHYVAFSPDSRFLAAGDPVKPVIQIYDIAAGRQLQPLPIHYNGGGKAAFSPNSKVLANMDQGQISLWDVTTGRQLISIPGDPFNYGTLIFSSDGKTLAFGSFNKIKLLDAATGRVIRTLEGKPWYVQSLAFSPDDRILAAGGWNNNITLWDVASGAILQTLMGHSNMVETVAFSPDGRLLASGSRDTQVKLWDVDSGAEVASLLAMDPEDWLVVTPDGLFDGSPAAWNRILWRFDQNTFDVAPVEAFFNEYYYPGLLTEILSGKRPPAPKKISQLDRRQPELKLKLANRQASSTSGISSRAASLRIEVAQAGADNVHPAGSGVRDVRLFRNGSLVKAWRGDVKLDGAGRATLEATIPIVAGENRLTAYAFNRDNIKSSDATLVVTGADTLMRAGTAYVIAVGINQYDNPQYNLKYARADAQAFGEEFARLQKELGRYAKVEVVNLFDRDATKANILLALSRLRAAQTEPTSAEAPKALEKLNPAQPEDAVIIFFAGHGTAQQQRFYLIPHDLGYQGSRSDLEASGLRSILAHSVSDVELEQAVEGVDAGNLLMVIDACNSGQALEAEEKRRGPMNSKGLAQLAYEKGMNILTAAQSYQAAIGVAKLGHGYLTYALVEDGLKTSDADLNNDGQVIMREWLDFATRRVPQIQEEGMKERRELELVEDRTKVKNKDLDKETLQRPRVFYRREQENQPLIVAKKPPQNDK